MNNYTVTFIQYHTYEVKAENECEAKNKAYKEFESDMRSPIANTFYDEIDIEIEYDEDDEYDDEDDD